MDKRLLVVDDIGLNRKLIEKKVGYYNGICLMDVLHASDAYDGLSYIKNTKLDAVVCDIKLPDMSGIELYKKSLQIKPSLPFVFITALDKKEVNAELEKFGVNVKCIFYKPLDFNELRQFVYSLMGLNA